MKHESLNRGDWIIPPAVSFTMAYGGVIACWFIFLACTLRYPSVFHEGPYRMVDSETYWSFTGTNLGFTLWLLLSLGFARRAPAGVRRGQLTGIGVSLVFLGAIQFGGQALHTDLNKVDRMDPEVISRLVLEEVGANGQVVDIVRDALRVRHPGLRVAALRGNLTYQIDGGISYELELSSQQLRLHVYGCTAPIDELEDVPWKIEQRSRNVQSLVIPLPVPESRLEQLKQRVLAMPGPDRLEFR